MMENLFKKMERSSKKTIAIRSIILTVLPIIFGRILTVAINEEVHNKKIGWFVLFFIILATDILALIFFAMFDQRAKINEKDNVLMEKILEMKLRLNY